MELELHLSFGGQCRAAFAFYAQCLGGTITTMLTWGESPMAKSVPTTWHDAICHATLNFDGGVLAGVDMPPERYEKPQGFQIILNIGDPLEADRIFGALAEGGSVTLPIQRTFWAVRYGAVVDKFGVPWEINCGNGSGDAAA